MRLVKLASEAGCTYSRYADDLTFSTNKKEFPASIAVPSGTKGAVARLWSAAEGLRKVIERSGFRINSKKTHLMYRDSRQAVTGLVTNKKLNVRWEYRNTVRAMVHRLVRTGAFEILGVKQANGQAVLEKRPGSLSELQGMLGFIDSIEVYKSSLDPPDGETVVRGGPVDEMPSRDKVYREFLMYSTFYAAATPVIICEGDTDNVYLTHAIRGLAREFPDLAEERPDKRTRLKVRLYKHSRLSSTAQLLGLGGGSSSVLSKFMRRTRRSPSTLAARHRRIR